MGDLYNKPGKLIIKGNPNIDWITWKKCFENYLVVSGMDGVKDERKIVIMINLIGEDGQLMYDNFKYEAEEDKKKFDVVMKEFEEVCELKLNLTVERFNFFNTSQREGEPFETFLIELRNKAATCEFGEQRDRIVCGIQDRTLQKRLLSESDLSLNTGIQFCQANELSEKQVRTIQEVATQQVDAIKSNYKGPRPRSGRGLSVEKPRKITRKKNDASSANGQVIQCSKCNKVNVRKRCPAFGKECFK